MRKSLLLPITALLLFAGMYLSSCKKDDENLGPVREFATSGNISVNAGQTSALLSWKEAVNTDSTTSSYTVEISEDSAFASTSKFTYVTQGTTLTVRDTQLTVRVKYYARVKTNGATPSLDSKWVYSSKFSLTGEQIFLPVKDIEVKYNSVILRWVDTVNADPVKIVLTPKNGTATEYPLDPADIDSSFKKIEGLDPLTTYHAQLFSATKEVGFTDFVTKDVPVYAYTINPTMDLAAVLDTCRGSIIIGLDTGTYTTTLTYGLKGKSVTLMSVSGNPADTKVTFKEFKLSGTGAGINMKDLSFDGLGTASYFLNFAGLAADADPATFANVSLENCRISNYGNCLMRANRGTAAGDQKIGSVTMNNCVVYNNLLTSLYNEFTFDKLGFQTLSVTNSTFYTVGRAMVLMSTLLPSGNPTPVVVFDHNTINSIGAGTTSYLLLDANTNPVQASFTNNIIANSPRNGALNAAILRATATTSSVVFSYNDIFKLTNGTAALTFPTYVTQAGNQQIDLLWTLATSVFTLPATSPLRTASSTGGPIGDPRWY